jgi:tripartite-type tricarboxylate transporter receptor subunit TctC
VTIAGWLINEEAKMDHSDEIALPLDSPRRRDVLRSLGALAVGGATSTSAWSQAPAYPSRNIIMTLPTGPGSPSDLVGRKLGVAMGQIAKVTVVPDNRAGANGIIGVQAVLNAPADGYNMMFTTLSTMAVNKALIKDLPYDPMKDFIVVAYGMRIWLMVAVSAKTPFKTTQELIDYAKANPGKLNFGYGSSTPQIGGKLFEQRTGARFTFVPYKTHPAMLTALITGEVDLSVTDEMSLASYIKAGQIRPLALAGPKRLANIPDMPTLPEVGVSGNEFPSSSLALVKAGTPAPVVARLAEIVKQAAETKEMRDYVAANGFDDYLVTGPEATRELQIQMERIAKIARDAGLEPS